MRARIAAALVATVIAAACGGRGPLGPEYEYEEDLTLSLDGSATMVVNSSVAALVALHDLPLNADPRARADQLKSQVRGIYSAPGTQVGRVSTWTRHGRRFVGVRLDVDDIRALPRSAPFAWSAYELREQGDQVVFRHALIGPAASKPPTAAAWKGNEIVAFRLHLPARIRFHNSRDLETNAPLAPARGNILTWEQRLAERLERKPIAYAEDTTPDVMEVRMDRESILYRTLWLFAIAFAAAVLVIGGLIWLAMRRAPADPPSSSRLP
jgi:hypothetical protein